MSALQHECQVNPERQFRERKGDDVVKEVDWGRSAKTGG